MTPLELRNLFNLQYNNIFSAAAPALNDYEISLYLTKAVKELVQTYYTGQADGNPVDSTEELRELLAFYTKEKNITEIISGNSKYNCEESIVSLDNNVWYILNEYILTNDRWLRVKPISYDQLHGLLTNPYKQPNAFRAYRVEQNSDEGLILKIYSKRCVDIYSINYIEVPEPIIISSLSDVLPGLTIESKATVNIPRYPNNWLWDLIINRAVELATRDYKSNDLNSQVQLNSRVQ